MSYERRGNGTYFYKKFRKGDKVTSVYIGPANDWLIRCDEQLKEIREREKEEKRREGQEKLDQIRKMEGSFLEPFRQIENYVSAVLIASGYHHHKGEWRKERGQ